MRRWTIFAICAAIWLAMAPVTLAAEERDCNDPKQNTRWRGQSWRDANQKHGASGTAEAHNLVQCINPDLIELNGTSIFSNVVPDNGGFNDIVQVGMGNCRASNCVGGMRYYSGWGRTSTTPGCAGFSNRFPAVADEGAYGFAAHDFKVHHSANLWKFYVGLAQVHSIGEASICWTGRSAVWFGEVWDIGDQMGGTPANKLSITSTNYANAEGGGFFWTNFNAANACNYGGAGVPYFCDLTGARSLDVWTDR